MSTRKKLTMPKPDTRATIRRAHHGVDRIERWWFVTDEGQLVRGLAYTDYSYCEHGEFPREFELRLAPDDPRPLGRRIFHGKYWTDAAYVRALAVHHLKMPVGVWHGPSLAPSRELRPYSDATALVLVPPAPLARGEERAA